VLKITLNPNHPSIPGSYEDRIAANVNPYGVVVGMENYACTFHHGYHRVEVILKLTECHILLLTYLGQDPKGNHHLFTQSIQEAKLSLG